MIELQNFYRTFIETAGKRSVKTHLIVNTENKDTTKSLTVIADVFNKKTVNFASTVEGPTTEKLI